MPSMWLIGFVGASIFVSNAASLEEVAKLRTVHDGNGYSHVENSTWPTQGAAPAGSTFRVMTADEAQAKIDGLSSKLDQVSAQLTGRIDEAEKKLQDIRTEMLKRFDQLPLEVAQNEEAYNLLQAKLRQDLADVFHAKE